MKYETNILNKDICQILLFTFFMCFDQVSSVNYNWSSCFFMRIWIYIIAYSFFFLSIKTNLIIIIELFRCSLKKRKALPLMISIAWRKFIASMAIMESPYGVSLSHYRWQQKIWKSSGNIVERLSRKTCFSSRCCY